MKKKGFRSVRRNKRRTMQTGGGHDELIKNILLGDYNGVHTNIATLPIGHENREAKPNNSLQFPVGGRTALYLACRLPTPNPRIVTLLLENGFVPNSRNNADVKLGNGAYPLHGVVESIKVNLEKDGIAYPSSYVDIIRLLKDKGADLEVKNSSKRRDGSVGMTAYDEYYAYVKKTTKSFYPKFDIELNNALFPPSLRSLSIVDDRTGELIYVPPSVDPTPPPPPPHRPVYGAAAAAVGQQTVVWQPPLPPPPYRPPPPDRMIPAYGATAAAVRPTGLPPGLPPPGPPPTGSPGQAPSGSITIQPTQSLEIVSAYSWPIENTNPPPVYSSRNDTDIDPKNAFVLCPTRIEEAFRSLLGNRCINMTLKYSQERPIKLPASIADFNGKHLQVLARNESVNTTGLMKTSLYGGVLTVEEIATIRCLVKNTTVVGITYPEKKGGYGGDNPPPPTTIPRKLTILVDQCGLQWQNSIYNTGALFFYPSGHDTDVVFQGTDQTDKQFTHTTLGKYRKWQNDTYFIMYGQRRPHVDAADPYATWTANGQNIMGKLKSPVLGFKTEFKQAFDSVRFMADKTPSITQVHFKFLRAGLGFFSENIQLVNKSQFLETARLRGICDGILELGGDATIMRTKIKKIILPFQTVRIHEMNQFGAFLATSVGDVFEQNPDPAVTIATTNCADPHAGPGNEGQYQSVDAAIASNTYVHHLNAAFNYANIQSKTFEEIGPVVPLVHVQPPAAHGSPFYPGQVFDSPPGGAVYSPAAAYPPAAAAAYPPPAAAASSFAAVASIPPPSIRPGSPRGQQGCWDPVKRVWTIFCEKISRRNSVAPGPGGGSGGRNRNRKQQRHQKPRATRKYKNKNKNKKHSRRS